ncbi:hypothetical protein HKX48_005628 [Thoreauomyces humboldtii]|nr:hypothetical protein HKX48_005628 [Thoreauomyces humboldtii]
MSCPQTPSVTTSQAEDAHVLSMLTLDEVAGREEESTTDVFPTTLPASHVSKSTVRPKRSSTSSSSSSSTLPTVQPPGFPRAAHTYSTSDLTFPEFMRNSRRLSQLHFTNMRSQQDVLPPYEPAGPPPGYDAAAATSGADGTVWDDGTGFESSESLTMRRGGLRWWSVAVIGSDVLCSTFLFLVTLAKVSQDYKGLSPATVVLPVLYVVIAAYGKASVTRDRSHGKVLYTVFFALRWISDLLGLVLIMNQPTEAGDDAGGSSSIDPDSASLMSWVVEIARVPVVGMRLPEYGESEYCGLGSGGCTWRLAVWGAMLVVDCALFATLCARLRSEFRHAQEIKPRGFPTDPNDDGFMTSVQVVPHNPFDSPTVEVPTAVLTTHSVRRSMRGPPVDVFRPRPDPSTRQIEEDDDERPLALVMRSREEEEEDSRPLGLVLRDIAAGRE